MKKIITMFFLLCAFAASSKAQWTDVVFNGSILTFGVHDTNFFASEAGHVYRYAPWVYPPNRWLESDGGITFTNLNVTSFATLGSYSFAGTTEIGNNANSVIYRSADNGGSWILIQAHGPVVTNGKYLFGNSLSSAYRSTDSGNNWQTLNCPEVGTYAAIGACIFANTNSGLMRSPDTGNTWSNISAPFNYCTMTVMSSLLFMIDTGSVAVTTDSGTKWQAVSVDTAGEYEHVTVLVTDGKNLFAGTGSGVLVSTDSGQTWHNGGEDGLPSKAILTLGVFDTLLFCQVQGARGLLFTGVRPISELTKDTTASVVQAQSLDSLSIFPNPAMGTVTILAGGTSVFGVSILNVLGEDVLDVPNIRESEISLDFSELPSGTYFMRIQTLNKSVLRKVVIQH